MTVRPLFVWLILSCLVLCGCGGGDPAPATDAGAATSDTPDAPSLSSAAPTAPGMLSADATVRQAITSIKESRTDLLWELLPPSYQKDVNDVVREFGKSVDAEAWDGMMRMLNRYLSVSLAKHDMMIQTVEYQNLLKGMTSGGPLSGSPIDLSDPVKMKAYNAALSDAMIGLLGSDIGSVNGLKAFDGKKFTSGGLNVFLKNIRKLMDLITNDFKQNPTVMEMPAMLHLDENLSEITVSASNVQADSALVTISGKGAPESIQMVKVEGRWIPQSMAAGWSTMMKQAKAYAPVGAMMFSSQKSMIMELVNKVDPLLGNLQNAKTQEEFNLAYRQVQLVLMTPLAASTGMEGLAPAGSSGILPVNVIVEGELDLATTRKIVSELEGASDRPTDAIVLVESGSGQTVFRLTPVEDITAFSGKLTFGTVGGVNALEKSIRISVKPGSTEGSATTPPAAATPAEPPAN